ncbi:endo alpha-1,4 polygalactosaminidase [Kitasatospora sp. NPDC048296]|uniref:endo alpha-1,4 polygalactosaminidase n=1 Tax=Kitasatospora sp. NPDC048296 TaxID=3364048 RepID=UPI00371A8090
MNRRTRLLPAALALATATALLVSSCSSSGSEDDQDSADGSPSNSPAATAPSTPGTPSATDTPSTPGTPGGTTAPGTPGATTAPATPPGSSTPPGTTAPAPAGARWQPTPGLAWQWQLGGTVDQSVDVPVYDIDGFENDASVVAALHAKGRKVICYINAGSWEDFRPDSNAFAKALQGSDTGWKGEKWFDIRKLDQLKPLMAARFDMCRSKGFDAIEPDTIEAYNQNSGFPLTPDDQLAYNRMLAQLAHERGLAIGLKNDLDQIPALLPDFDFAVNEECSQFDECDRVSPFIKAGKAVFHVEYKLDTDQFCAKTKALGFSSMQKKLDLNAWRKPC